MPLYISQASTNPLTRVLGVLVALLTLVGAFFFGLVILVVIFGVGLLLYAALRIRMWWLRRHMPAAEPASERPSGQPPESGEVIDAEYTVISTKRD